MQSFFDALARPLSGDAREIMLGFSLSDASRLERYSLQPDSEMPE
jgi:hypothetical protein